MFVDLVVVGGCLLGWLVGWLVDGASCGSPGLRYVVSTSWQPIPNPHWLVSGSTKHDWLVFNFHTRYAGFDTEYLSAEFPAHLSTSIRRVNLRRSHADKQPPHNYCSTGSTRTYPPLVYLITAPWLASEHKCVAASLSFAAVHSAQ
jgi:hypothetical protein